jgi:serine/threonine protein kinase
VTRDILLIVLPHWHRYSGYFSEGQLRDIMRQLFAGLGYLHMCHVMHRDIKPDNILVEHQEVPVSSFTGKGFVHPGGMTLPFNSNVVWKRMCPEGFSLQCEYVLLPADDGHFHLAYAADPSRTPVLPLQLPLSRSFALVSVDVRVRIADFGLARE